jgi:hypothetical protein
LFRLVILAAAVAAGLAAYFALSLYFLPQSYLAIEPRRPEPAITNVMISADEIALGQSFTISITGVNNGDEADMQTVSVGFPDLTNGSATVLNHNFAQTPRQIRVGQEIGSRYSGFQQVVNATYPAIEASSRPWRGGSEYSIEMQVTPEKEGEFTIFVKSVALPHSWDGAHYPQSGTLDQQGEFARVYSVNVAKP